MLQAGVLAKIAARGVHADGVIATPKITPLDSIPQAQRSALRARGIEISNCH